MPCGYCAKSKLNESAYSRKLSGYKTKVTQSSSAKEIEVVAEKPQEPIIPPVEQKVRRATTTMTYAQFSKL